MNLEAGFLILSGTFGSGQRPPSMALRATTSIQSMMISPHQHSMVNTIYLKVGAGFRRVTTRSTGHFLKALEIAKCDASEALHIGDCPVNDVGGARNCNFNTIWFNCDRKKWDEIFPCELQAKNWKELNEVINKNFLLEKNNV